MALPPAGGALGSTVGATSSRSTIGGRFANASHNGASAQVLGGYAARGHQLGWWRGLLSTTRGYAGKKIRCVVNYPCHSFCWVEHPIETHCNGGEL